MNNLQTLQLKQIKNHDAKLYQAIRSKRMTIAQAMIKLAHNLTTPPTWNEIYETIKTYIENQEPSNILPGSQRVIATKGDIDIIIWRDKVNDELRLFSKSKETGAPLSLSSRPIGHFSRDWTHLSSALAGEWKLYDRARRVFDEWVTPVPQKASPWRKAAGTWLRTY